MMDAWIKTPPDVGHSVVLEWADGDEITVTRQTAGIVIITRRSEIATTMLTVDGDVWRGETLVAGGVRSTFHAPWNEVSVYV